jgi:hypothetical protein
MRTVIALVAVTMGLAFVSTANAQTRSVFEWRVGAQMGSFATIIMLEVSNPPVVVYRICHTKGAATGLAIKINCAPDGRVAPDPTKACFERIVAANTCQDVAARESIALRRYSAGSGEDSGTFELLTAR